jgi:hypothetical protein
MRQLVKPDVLKKIEAYKREELRLTKREHSLGNMLLLAKAALPPRGFISALRRKHAAEECALIAENQEGVSLQRAHPKGFSSRATCESL